MLDITVRAIVMLEIIMVMFKRDILQPSYRFKLGMMIDTIKL